MSQTAPQDLSKLLNINTNDPQQYYDLLSYYRSKIGEFEKERFEWLTKVEEIRIQYDEKHQLEWQLIKRKEEINELQKSMSEAKLMLFEERQTRLKLQKDNDTLKVRELEDRKKISELMAMLDPIQEQVVLQKDLRPEVTTKYTQDTLAVRDKLTGNMKMQGVGQGKSIMKTVYMPNDQLNAYQLENDNLKRQLEQAHNLINQQFASLREELRLKDVENHLKKKEDGQKIDQLTQKVQKIEKQNVDLVKEYYNTKQRFQAKEQQHQEETEVMRLKNQKLKMELDNVLKKNSSENKVALELLEKKSEEYSKKFRTQIKSKDDQLSIIKEQYSQVQNIYIDKIRQLEENLSRLIGKYQQLEKRRTLEIEGFKTDIKLMNAKFKEYEKQAQEKQVENKSAEELQKLQAEAEQIKQQLHKETHNIYSAKKQQTIKQRPKSQQAGKQNKTLKPKQMNIKSREQMSDVSDDDKAVSESMPLNELEDIQRQLDELERQMDQAKKQ